jgi:hypothetical protein
MGENKLKGGLLEGKELLKETCSRGIAKKPEC